MRAFLSFGRLRLLESIKNVQQLGRRRSIRKVFPRMGIVQDARLIYDEGGRHIDPLVVNHQLLGDAVERAYTRRRMGKNRERVLPRLFPILRPEMLLRVHDQELHSLTLEG